MTIEQGTIREFDPDAQTGSLFLDDGRTVTFDAAAFQAGGLRLLRSGQRVRFDRGPAGEVTRVTLVTLP
jgi:cold shock CspA family protein